MKKLDELLLQELFVILSGVGDPNEMSKFLKDLLTPKELGLFARRWYICKLLARGDMSHRDIKKVTGAGFSTIARIDRFLKIEPNQGYKSILSKLLSG